MATASQMFLRLPPSLRQHMLLQEPARLGQLLRASGGHNISRRTFQTTARLEKRNISKPVPKSTLQVPQPKPLPASSPFRQVRKAPEVTTSTLEQQTIDKAREPITVLLYTSPNHGTFFVSSFVVGGLFLFGAWAYAQTMLKESPDGVQKSTWIKILGASSVLPVVGFGTLFILAPQKMIKSIAVVAREPNITAAVAPVTRLPRTLRIEVKRTMPFVKPDVMEVKTTDVAMDRNVPMVLNDLNYMSVSKENAGIWTEDYFSGRFKPDSGAKGVVGNLMGIFPAIMRETRRMFLRDQMARLHVEGNGTFKLDLRRCCMLENGRSLDDVLGGRVMDNMSLISRLRSIVAP